MAVRKRPTTGTTPKDIKTSRRAAGVNVLIAIGAATALLILINVVGHLVGGRHNLRWNVETLGRYGLSETAKKILDQVRQPVRLTSIYTSAKLDRKPEQYLPAVRDLLAEMRQYKGDITAINVTSDRAKAEVVARLRKRLDDAAERHKKLIEVFQIFAKTQEGLFGQEIQKWRAYPPAGWLGRLGLPKAFETYLSASSEALKKLAALIRQELNAAALPNYPALADQIEDTLGQVQAALERISTDLGSLAELPAKVQAAQKDLTASAKAVTTELGKAVEAVGQPGSPAPSAPSKVLGEVVAAGRAAAEAARKATAALVQLDEGVGQQLRNLASWRAGVVSLSQLAGNADDLANQVQQINVAVKVELQKQVITEQLRPQLPNLVKQAQAAESALARMIAELSRPDQPTTRKFDEAGKDDFLQAQLEPIREMLRQAGELGELPDQTELIEQIAEDNIVLVEVGEQAGVVPFDDVWPLAPRSDFAPPGAGEEPERRVFNGGMAVCAKVLEMTAEPFAEVVLTFYEQMPPPMMRERQAPISGPIPSLYLQNLRQRLNKANMEIKEWNLATDDEPPAPDKRRKQVLLVLPPPDYTPPMMGPQQMPRFGPEHVEKVKRAIADGSPAIFLAGHLRPRFWGQMGPPEYGFADYLKDEWSLNVRIDLRVVLGERDPLEPDKFVMPVLRWDFLPLSTFSDTHPVGKPLRARRFYWLSACPVARAEGGKAKVNVEEILGVPEGTENIWATAKAEELWQRIITGRGTGIAPDPGGGDMLAPFALAAEAGKTVEGKNLRVIVLGVGLSYIDGFLTYRIPQIKGGQTLATEPPPTGNVDLVVNCVYHLLDKGDYIGAGPAVVQPIRLIRPATMTLVKIVFGFLWPALMIVAGGLVLLARKR